MPIEFSDVRQLFKLLHGMYGNHLLDKYRIGDVYRDGEHAGHDKGVVSAQQVWLASLKHFDYDTIRAAAERCKKVHKTFAPTLPEFEEICHALQPRHLRNGAKTEAPALPISDELKQEMREKNREALARAKLKRIGDNDFGMGVQALAALVAKAAGDAGGDEVAVLMRLEAGLKKKGVEGKGVLGGVIDVKEGEEHGYGSV